MLLASVPPPQVSAIPLTLSNMVSHRSDLPMMCGSFPAQGNGAFLNFLKFFSCPQSFITDRFLEVELLTTNNLNSVSSTFLRSSSLLSGSSSLLAVSSFVNHSNSFLSLTCFSVHLLVTLLLSRTGSPLLSTSTLGFFLTLTSASCFSLKLATPALRIFYGQINFSFASLSTGSL